MTYKGDKRLGELFGSRRERGIEGLPTLSVTIRNGLVDRYSIDRKTETNLTAQEHLLARKGDIAYNMMRMWQGASGLVEQDGIVSPAYIVLSPRNGVDSKYASYFFKSSRMIYLFWAYSHGLTKDRLRLYYDDFAQIPISVPPVKEQSKIARILSTWDQAIATTEKLIANSKQHKKALMQRLLTGKNRLSGFNGKWTTCRLEDRVNKMLGGGTPDRNNTLYWNGNIPWLTVKDLTAEIIYGSKEHITKYGLTNSASHLIPAGTVIIATRMAVGKSVITTRDVAINQDLKAIFTKDNLAPKYLHYWLLLYAPYIARLGGGSTVKGISISAIKKLSISLPSSTTEQLAIVKMIEMASQMTDRLENYRVNLQRTKEGLMQQLLTGKRRVKLDS